jgi:hypothetical protein
MGAQSPRAMWETEAKIATTETTKRKSRNKATQKFSLSLKDFIFSLRLISRQIISEEVIRLAPNPNHTGL